MIETQCIHASKIKTCLTKVATDVKEGTRDKKQSFERWEEIETYVEKSNKRAPLTTKWKLTQRCGKETHLLITESTDVACLPCQEEKGEGQFQ